MFFILIFNYVHFNQRICCKFFKNILTILKKLNIVVYTYLTYELKEEVKYFIQCSKKSFITMLENFDFQT